MKGNKGTTLRSLAILGVLLLTAHIAGAHVIDYELDPVPDNEVFGKYLGEGFRHILPLGVDHILFVLCVFLLQRSLKKVLLQATVFTLAHSVTLGLAMYGVIEPPGSIVEPLIAASIVVLALENVFSKKVSAWRLLVVFLFGLVHGMGFAGALGDLGMPPYAFGIALAAFNIGVELGQVTVILAAWLILAVPFGKKPWYRRVIVIPMSLIIAGIAAWWTIERIFFTG